MKPLASSVSRANRHEAGEWVARLGRAGYVTKGVVYGFIGVLALQAALTAGGGTEGTRGAILEIADGPFGQVLLALIAVGLLGYALWRFVEAALDPDHAGTDARGLVKRVGYAVSGLVYLGLALWAARLVLGSGSAPGGGGSEQTWTAWLMAKPFGPWLVGLAGAVVVGVGLYHFYNAYAARFMRRYGPDEMDPEKRRWARRLGRFGLSARGVTFCIVGGFIVQAALQSDPSESRGLEGALQTLAAQPYGAWLLAAVALGFIAYGVYAISRARFSRFSTR